MILENDEDSLMAIAAFRYCLGRQTYIVGVCIDWLRVIWKQLNHHDRYLIMRDVAEALMDDRAGSLTIDAPGWKKFLVWAFKHSDKDQEEQIKRTTAYKNKPWPI